MNHMKQVAEMLGLELNEEFKINGQGVKYHFETDGLHCSVEEVTLNHLLPDLLLGKYEIMKEPWKPMYNEKYYTVDVFCGAHTALQYAWRNTPTDYMRLATGNYFRTRDEASAAIPWFRTNIERLKRGESWEVRE